VTFLKKLGQFLAKAVAIAVGIGPILQPFLGSGTGAKDVSTGINDLTQVGQVVVSAEALLQTPGSGAAKLAAATPLVQTIIQSSELIAGKKIANDTLFTQGCSKITSGVADCLNALHPDGVATS
jgi:hypothetical protein